MFTLILTVLNRDCRVQGFGFRVLGLPLIIIPIEDSSYKGELPNAEHSKIVFHYGPYRLVLLGCA